MRKPLRAVRTMTTALTVAGRSAVAAGALATASSQVVAARVALGMTGAADPMKADYAELARILPEKAQAASAAGMILMMRSGRVAQQVAAFATAEMTAAASAAVTMAACRSPAALAAAQASYVQGWMGRLMKHSFALGMIGMRGQHATMAPYRQAAAANARRLGK